MLNKQKHLFDLSDDSIYLNGAYMSPQLKSVTEVGIKNIIRKSDPSQITPVDFFTEKVVLKKRFASLIQAENFESVAIIPSVSYGVAIVVNNIPFEPGDEIVVLEEQFPSNYYAWKDLEKEKGVIIRTITSPPLCEHRAKKWNQKILDAISVKTKAVAVPIVHWADGTLFNIKNIRDRTNDVNAYLIIDGTQSIGVMPFSVAAIKPDALICAGYKWLMGPYGLGVAYFSDKFYDGKPLENGWINHEGSEDFSNLVNYNVKFKPFSARYDAGESSNFILTPMLSEAIRQLLEWTPKAFQEYCRKIGSEKLNPLIDAGFFIEEPNARAHHIFGIYLPEGTDHEQIKERLATHKIFISYRGNAIRISPSVYNSEEELEKLVSCFI